VEGSAIAEGGRATGVGEALGVVHLRLSRVLFTHKILALLKPHPVPGLLLSPIPPVENSPHYRYDEGLPALSRTFHEPPAEPPLVPDEHCDERQDGKDAASSAN